MIVPKLRRQSRELALQVLFQQEFSPTMPFAEALERFRVYHQAPAEVWQYAEVLLNGVNSHKDSLDQTLQANSAHWKLERMALVELNIMRIAAFEIVHMADEVPGKTAINEAVEVSKKYGSSESGSYVNGVLDQILKSLN
ncbi:MAG: transcription antitermination factor NusB [Bdellovibrionales bacterium]|nr:transcription antitermination factor NusB [Bdellovibrionales bacterium]